MTRDRTLVVGLFAAVAIALAGDAMRELEERAAKSG